jgi:hypothetical protein
MTFETAMGLLNASRLSLQQRASFVAWASANLKEAEPINQGDTVAAGSFTAGARVDRLVRAYRAREDARASYAEAMTFVLSQPENAELKIAFSRETGRAAR